jgi:transposase
MDSALITPVQVIPADAESTPLVVLPLAELQQLRAELAKLRRENLELRQQVGYWRSRHTDALGRFATLKLQNEQFRGEIRKLQAERFGRRSEKQSRSDRSNELEDPANSKPKRKRGRQPGQPAPKRRDYSHLPAREQVIDLPETQLLCPHCAQPLKSCGSEDSEQLEIEIVVYRRVIHRRRGQRTCDCPGPVTVTAPPAAKLIPKSLLGTSVWAFILPGQVRQSSADATAVGAMAVLGAGPGVWHHH